ncbi:phage capsid protein [Shigella sp. FC1655]|uniref:phage capsid protein n=1 Tax=unclassified Shigella TaxID=2629414 RepID=UPI0008482787|nr:MULTISPECIES: phage capsid protein [unclassified Shigella]ODQ07199.1 phage capsid protein [Shigella sp. FC130]OEI94596.1 phage capsid protein [Shigella sp. FC1655]
MENELIIDGQAVPVSENQESQQQENTDQPTQVSENNAADNAEVVTGDSAKVKPDHSVEQEQDYSLQIGDEEISLTDDDDSIEGKTAPQWVKDLRKGFKDTQKENRELRRQLEEITAKQTQEPAVNHNDEIPQKPTLESCDWSEEAYEKALTDWYEKKSRADQSKKAKEKEQLDYKEKILKRLEDHKQRASKLPVKDYAEMEEIVTNEVPIIHQEILLRAADEGTELIAYALGKNKELRQRLTAEKDPIRAAFLIGQLSQKVKLAPKPKKAPRPEPEVKGGAGSVTTDELNKLCPGAIIE